MRQKTVTYRFSITGDQWASLKVLDCYGVNVSQFIRNAITEKINRDWSEIKSKQEKEKLPF